MPALYDSIGVGYGRTRRADPELADTLARLLALPAGGRGLDLACGSGNYTLAMAARGGHWTGLDESATMLAQAARTAAPVVWVRGDASALPFADDSFDAALCTLAIHHFGALDAPFAELRRVLRPGGRCVIFTAFAEQMQAYWLGRYFPRMMALSMQKMPSCAAVLKALGDAGFAGIERLPYHVSAGLRDLFLYAGKHRPQLYLDAAVRANISSFATLCAAQELAAGLDALRADLAHGRWAGVAADAPAEGDYAFVIVRK